VSRYPEDAHRSRADQIIAAEPWCHRLGGCPHEDAGTPGNALTADHPWSLDALEGDVGAWKSQPLVPMCHLCCSATRVRQRASRR
jgi:hypothetical protein